MLCSHPGLAAKFLHMDCRQAGLLINGVTVVLARRSRGHAEHLPAAHLKHTLNDCVALYALQEEDCQTEA